MGRATRREPITISAESAGERAGRISVRSLVICGLAVAAAVLTHYNQQLGTDLIAAIVVLTSLAQVVE